MGLRQVECFHHHTLAGEGSIAVDEDRQHLVARFVEAPVLARAHGTFHDRVNNLKVGRIKCQGQMNDSPWGLNIG